MRQELADPVLGLGGRRPRDLDLAAAAAFFLGGSLFALGALFAQLGVALVTVNLTYLVGGGVFSIGGFLSILLVDPGDDSHTAPGEQVPWWRSRNLQVIGWLSAVILFAGTLLFAVSLVAAFAEGLTPRQSNGWIWLPDILGCLCFLASGHLALRDVCGGHAGVRLRSPDWWVVAVNQAGSVLFFLAGIAAFTRPTTSEYLDAELVNWGTFAGAVCFAVAGAVQAFHTPTTRHREARP